MKKSLLALGIIAALGLRLFMMAVALQHPERTAAGNDERVHNGLADSLLRGAGFTMNAGPSDPRNITRVPCYPVLIAAAKVLAGARFIPALIAFQNILALAVAAMLFLFIKPRYGERAAWIALLISLADIPTIVFSDLLLTEIPYLFLSVVSMMLFVTMMEGTDPFRLAVFAGATASLAALCRPIHQFFPFLLALAGLATHWKRRAAAGRTIALFLCVYVAGIAPWLARNYLTYGKAELTHLTAVHAYMFKAGGVLAVVEGRDIEEVKRDLERKARDEWGIANINEDPRSGEMLSFARRTIAQHPLAFGYSTLAGVAGNALMPEKGALYGLMGERAPRFNLAWSERKPGAGLAGSSDAFGIAGIAIVAFQAAVLCVIYAIIGYGFVSRRVRAGDFLVLLSVAAVAYYYLAPAGAESTPRFRIPAVPYLCVLAAACIGGRKPDGK